jgi:hypothetical protein
MGTSGQRGSVLVVLLLQDERGSVLVVLLLRDERCSVLVVYCCVTRGDHLLWRSNCGCLDDQFVIVSVADASVDNR